jgi:hypothetical protein
MIEAVPPSGRPACRENAVPDSDCHAVNRKRSLRFEAQRAGFDRFPGGSVGPVHVECLLEGPLDDFDNLEIVLSGYARLRLMAGSGGCSIGGIIHGGNPFSRPAEFLPQEVPGGPSMLVLPFLVAILNCPLGCANSFVQQGAKGGKKGGKARMAALTPAERTALARTAGKASAKARKSPPSKEVPRTTAEEICPGNESCSVYRNPLRP